MAEWLSPGIRWKMLSSEGVVHNTLDQVAHAPIKMEAFDSARIGSRGQVIVGFPTSSDLPLDAVPTTLITHHFCDVYYHWLFDILPRIRYAVAVLGDSCAITLPRPRFQFQQEWLALAAPGVSIAYLSDSEKHISGPVLIPSSSTTGTVVAPWGIHAFQEIAHNIPPKVDSPRVYVQRKGAVSRRIVNEAELESTLEREGFIVVDAAALSVTEQIALFKGARTIVSAHGSALANLIFCRPGTSVIEVFGPRCGETCYPRIAQQMQLLHLGVQATELSYFRLGDRLSHLLKRRHAPFHFKVDLALISRALALVK
jgi:capsular polysaccharide biosynthesis protein